MKPPTMKPIVEVTTPEIRVIHLRRVNEYATVCGLFYLNDSPRKPNPTAWNQQLPYPFIPIPKEAPGMIECSKCKQATKVDQ